MRFEVLLGLSCPGFQSVIPCKVGDNAAMAAKQQNHPHSETAGVKSKAGGGFARSTRAGGLKHVTRASASLAGQEVIVDQGAKCESIVLLKNLAKQLVDRIEAACAARSNTSQVSNPNKVRNTATDSRLLHGPEPRPEVNSGPSVSVRRSEDHEVGNSCQSHEYGSNILSVDDEPCAVPEEKANPPYLSTQKHSGHLGDNRPSPDITERNRRVRSGDDARRCLRGGRHDLELESHSCSRGASMVTTHSSSLCDKPGTFRPDSRPTRERTSSPGPGSRGNTGNVACMNSQMQPLKKANVGLEPPKTEGVHPTPRRKIRSPGLRSLVVPQVKDATAPPAGLPANTKLVLSSSSTPIQKHTEDFNSEKEPALQGVGALELEELYKTVWADVVQDVFDEVFRGEEEPSHAANRKQAPSSSSQLSNVPIPHRASEDWIIQTQSTKYRFGGRERAASRSGVHKTGNVDRQYLKIPREESPASREPSNSAQCSTRSTEDVSCKAPVILPTLAKYHMDKIERYKKGVAEKQLRERRFQQECRPSTAPDPYNVLNVYAERCASQIQHSRPTTQRSEHALDWQVDERRAVDNPT